MSSIKRRRLFPVELREDIRAYIFTELKEALDLRLCEAGSEWSLPADLAAHLPATFTRLDGWENDKTGGKVGWLRTTYRFEITYIRAMLDTDEPQRDLTQVAADLNELFTRDDFDWPYRLASAPAGCEIESVFAEGAEFPDPAHLEELELRLESVQIPVIVTVNTPKQ